MCKPAACAILLCMAFTTTASRRKITTDNSTFESMLNCLLGLEVKVLTRECAVIHKDTLKRFLVATLEM